MKRRRSVYGTVLVVLVLAASVGVALTTANAATSPTLVAAAGYSVLGGQAVTCTGPTTTTGAVGVSPLTSITGFTGLPNCLAEGGTDSANLSANAAQADATAAFTTLDQPCTQSFGASFNLASLSPLGPGVYCDTSSFSLTGTLTLTTGPGVWIFKTVSTIITSSGSSVTGGDPCNVWWRIGSSATLATTTSFEGTIIALNGLDAMQTGATLNGRILALSAGTVTLDNNIITGPTCETTGGGTTTTTTGGGTTPTTALSSTTTTAPSSTTTTAPSSTTTTAPPGVVAKFTG